MAVGNFYRASLIFSHPDADGDVVNVVDYEQTLIVVSKTESQYCSELAAELKGIAETDLMPLLTGLWELESVDCFNIDQPTFQGSVASGATGTTTGESIAIRSATVASKRTALRGRSYRGRMFIPSAPESAQAEGILTGAYVISMQTYVDNLISLVLANSNEYQLVVYSPTLITGTQVTTFTVQNTLGSLRGRQKV